MSQGASVYCDPAAPAEGQSSIDDYTGVARREHLVDLCEATYEETAESLLVGTLQTAAPLGAHYPPSRGSRHLREVIATMRAARDGVAVDPDQNVVIAQGATGALAALLIASVKKGDEVLTFTPGYPLPQELVMNLGGVLRQVVLNPPMQAGDPWTFDESAVRRAFGVRTRCVVVASPHNPTGKVFTASEFGTLADLCAAHGALLIADSVYEDFIYPPARLLGARAFAPQHVALIGSISKSLRSPGLRVGWLVAPRTLASNAARIVDGLSAGVCLPAQCAAAVALSDLPRSYWAEQRDAAQTKCRRLMAALETLDLRCLVPEGGLALLATSAQGNIRTDDDLTTALRRVGLGGVPLLAFERAPCQGRLPLVRLAFGRPNHIFERVEAIVAQALSSRHTPCRRV